MANNCMTSYAFYPSYTSRRGIAPFYNKVISLLVNGVTNLYDFAKAFGLTDDEITNKGMVIGCGFMNDAVILDVGSAWVPCPEIFDKIIQKCYTDSDGNADIEYVYQAEEVGCGVFVNTDIDGRYFPDLYRLEYCFAESENETSAVEVYFESTMDLLDWGNEFFDKSFGSVSEISEYANEKIKEQAITYGDWVNDECYFVINEFKEHL